MGQARLSGCARANRYAAAVTSGKEPACRWVRLAVARDLADQQRKTSKAWPYRFDQAKAERIVTAAELLPHIKGPLAKVIGRDAQKRKMWNTLALEPWQCWILTRLFGWVHRDTGARRFRVGLVFVPRKNAKSTMASVIGLYLVACDSESGAEVYSAATTRDQAKIVFRTAWQMARRSHDFCDQFGVSTAIKDSIEVAETASEFKALSADASTLDGLNPHGAIVDEVHAHKTRHVWDVLETAVDARTQPLLFPISTAGFNLAGIGHELLQFGHRVLEGVVDAPTFFAINYTIDEGDDWEQPATWRKANPNLGVSVDASGLRAKAIKAKHSPGALNNFLTKHLNVWVTRDGVGLNLAAWQASARTIRPEDYAGATAWIGVDMGARRDLSAVVVYIPTETGGVVFGRYYMPQTVADTSDIAQLSGWIHGGHVIATAGNTVDFSVIERDIVAWCRLFDVQEIACDPALMIRMGPALQEAVGEDVPVVEVPQTNDWQAHAYGDIDEAITNGRLLHDGNPALTWQVSCVVGRTVYVKGREAIVPRKSGGKDSMTAKIDGVLALMLARYRAGLGADDGSAYETRGVMVL